MFEIKINDIIEVLNTMDFIDHVVFSDDPADVMTENRGNLAVLCYSSRNNDPIRMTSTEVTCPTGYSYEISLDVYLLLDPKYDREAVAWKSLNEISHVFFVDSIELRAERAFSEAVLEQLPKDVTLVRLRGAATGMIRVQRNCEIEICKSC